MSPRTIDQKIVLIGLLALFLASGCSSKSDMPAEDQVVIRVDERVLTLAEFNEYFEPIRMSYDKEHAQDSVALREARLRFLLQLVEEMIILRRADELGIDISTQELDEAVRDFQKDYPETGFEYQFLKQAISFEAWKERLKKRLLIEKVTRKELLEEVSVTPQEIGDYYNEHWKEWSHGEEIRARHILLSSEDQAKDILKLLKNGDDFATLARAHSVAPEAQDGGDMGYVVRGQLPEALEGPLFDLKQGAVSRVVKTSYGFHIFQVIEKRETSKPKLEECIERIKQAIQKERLGAAYAPWLAKLRSRYDIEINEEVI
jgi:parvulin-like peptidyl-prolyl isomerase